MIGLLDSDHLQLNTAIVDADEQQPVIQVTVSWDDRWLAGVEHCLDRSALPDAVHARRRGEPDVPHPAIVSDTD